MSVLPVARPCPDCIPSLLAAWHDFLCAAAADADAADPDFRERFQLHLTWSARRADRVTLDAVIGLYGGCLPPRQPTPHEDRVACLDALTTAFLAVRCQPVPAG